MIETQKVIGTKTIWNGTATVSEIECIKTIDFYEKLIFYMECARNIKKEKDKHSSVEILVKSLSSHGLRFRRTIYTYDRDDVVGLVGEILLENYLIHNEHIILFPKWRFFGTSKARGIDVTTYVLDDEKKIVHVCEAKHIHDAAKGSHIHTLIRSKYITSFNELKEEKTKYDLAQIALKIDNGIRSANSFDATLDILKEKYAIVMKSIEDDVYNIDIGVYIDSKYCETDTLDKTIVSLKNPMNLGDEHGKTLYYIKIEGLELITDKVSELFA